MRAIVSAVQDCSIVLIRERLVLMRNEQAIGVTSLGLCAKQEDILFIALRGGTTYRDILIGRTRGEICRINELRRYLARRAGLRLTPSMDFV
jgi:hypothetical protein